jgi:hypothetical protein
MHIVSTPKSFWLTKFHQTTDKRVKFNFSIQNSAMLGIYGRRELAPSIVQYDFFEVIESYWLATGPMLDIYIQ